MSLLSFPDVNVWLALLLEHHVHRARAVSWWNTKATGIIAFTRITQMSTLRLLTTAAAMDGQPLTMREAWITYDRLLEDERVALFPEPANLEPRFREMSTSGKVSPKVWADIYLAAFAACHSGQVITFDRGLGQWGADCLILN